MIHICLVLLSLLQVVLASAFDINAKDNVAVYWGQASAGSQESLGTYCASDNVDLVVLSFLYQFPDTLSLDFASACSTKFDNGLLHCPSIAADIKSCQAKGKKVLLSLGGAIGSYGFTDDEQAEKFATTLWNTFGEGSDSSVQRPFDDAVVDGFDFDIENNNQIGYAKLATKLRELYKGGSRDYYLAAAPQCVYPDASVGDALANADIDFAFVQFYNNYCNVDKQFNWDTWADFADNASPNKDIKLYLGLPGSASAAGSGYISDLSLIKDTIEKVGSNSHFGGIMLWDASQSFTNEVEGETYAGQMKNILHDNTGSSPAVTSQSQAVTTSTTANTASDDPTTSTITISSTKTVVDLGASIASSTSVSTTKAESSTTVAPTTTSQAKTTAKTETSTELAVTTTQEKTTSTTPVNTATTTNEPATTHNTVGQTTTLQPTSSLADTPPQSTDSWAASRAKELNAQYSKNLMNGKDSCFDGEIVCSGDGKIAICNYGKWVYTECAAGTTCFAYEAGETVQTSCNFISLKP